MAVQAETDNTNVAFIRTGFSLVKNSTIAQDGSRSAVLAYGTLMAKVSATQLWTPFIDETATDGTAIPQGIYLGQEIAAATLVAGNVVDSLILVGGALTIDVNQLVIENSKVLTTVITVGTTDLRTVRDHMANRGIFVESTIDISSFEN
ncbi:MAG: hypothetical protein KAR42_15055 [candidate division Zixibacteria bacterium]|nr:hypothetical protein [candidate division Zixibacteria bacterium]